MTNLYDLFYNKFGGFRDMEENSVVNEDYTNVTITTIVSISLIIIAYFIVSDITEIVAEVSTSFSSSSALVLTYRILCFSASAYAIAYMFTCGPGNMRVVFLAENEDIVLYPVGKEKFVTFSSWTLIMCVAYFFLAILDQIINVTERDIGFISLMQTITFATGISMAFLTATVVRHIILPDEVRIEREHGHMFLYHEQIMHNFAAIFLAFEMLIVTPDLNPQLAVFGLLIGILYITFAYLFAYFGKGYFVYGFLHPRPKIAPIFITVLACSIAIFYLGLWYVNLVAEHNYWLSWLMTITWLLLIVQFRPNMDNVNQT